MSAIYSQMVEKKQKERENDKATMVNGQYLGNKAERCMGILCSTYLSITLKLYKKKVQIKKCCEQEYFSL